MKHTVALVLSLLLVFSLVCCGVRETYEIGIIVPSGSNDAFVYSEEEICSADDTVIISSGEGLGDTEIVLKAAHDGKEIEHGPTYLTPGMPIEMDVEKGVWFKVGISMQNFSDEDIRVTVKVDNVKQIRIN